jgi:hypothetical protein
MQHLCKMLLHQHQQHLLQLPFLLLLLLALLAALMSVDAGLKAKLFNLSLSLKDNTHLHFPVAVS